MTSSSRATAKFYGMNSSNASKEVGWLEYAPSRSVFELGCNNSSIPGTKLGFKVYGSNSYATYMPLADDKVAAFGASDQYMPLGLQVGSSGTVISATTGGMMVMPCETWTFVLSDNTTVTRTVAVAS